MGRLAKRDVKLKKWVLEEIVGNYIRGKLNGERIFAAKISYFC